MSYLINNQQKINDIIFANKNKAYGAYAIRSAYGNTIVKSLSIMLLGFGSIMAVAFYMSNRNNDFKTNLISEFEYKDTVYTVEINNEPIPEPPVTEQHEQQNNAGLSSNTATLIVESTTLEAKPSESVTGTGSSTLTSDGLTGTNTGSSTGTSTVVNSNTLTNEPAIFYDSAPEFEGGLKALYAFVGSKLKYPEAATEAGKEGTVYVKFVVDQNGKVGNLTLQNNAGYGFDEEALRVVSMIPNFKTPGMVGGKAVKVYFQLPIKFRMK
jgi:protein TonB